MDFINTLLNTTRDYVIFGGFHAHLAVLTLCVILAIVLMKRIFVIMFRQIAKNNEDVYTFLHEAFRDAPWLFGILLGIYVAKEFLAIPPRPLALLEFLFRAIVVMTITLLIAHSGSGYIKYKLGRASGRLASTSILTTTIDFAVYAIGILVLLESLGVSISPLLTALGVGGLATALALQDTLANVFSGINMLLSKQVKIGDFVKLSTGDAGHIVDMNWRNTTIKTTTENMIVVPNQKIASSVIINYAQPFAACSILIPIGVKYGSDLQRVEDITTDVAAQVLHDNNGGVDGFVPLVRYHDFGEDNVQFDVVLRVKTIMDQNFIRHQFIKAIYERYKQEGIEISIAP